MSGDKIKIRSLQEEADQKTYQVRNGCDFATIVVGTGIQSLEVLVRSSFGAYAYFWASTGPNPGSFMCSLNKSYAMAKLSDYKHMEPDLGAMKESIKHKIIEARREGWATKAEARCSWDDLVNFGDDHTDPELNAYDLVRACYDHIHFSQVFGDVDGLPRRKRMKAQCEGFWESIWLPFTEWYKKEVLT